MYGSSRGKQRRDIPIDEDVSASAEGARITVTTDEINKIVSSALPKPTTKAFEAGDA